MRPGYLPMRSRALFVGFVCLNVLFAIALVVMVTRSGNQSSVPPPTTLSSTTSNKSPSQASTPSTVTQPTNLTSPNSNLTSSVDPKLAQPPPIIRPQVNGKTFGWQEIEATNYLRYLDDLRGAGCPEKHIRQIVFEDANELFNQRRLQAALTHDFKWWQMETSTSVGGYNPDYQSKMQNLVMERRELLTRLLGETWEQEDKAPSLANHTVALTGPVLGGLPLDLYLGVQEICARSVSRHQDYLMGRFNEGQSSSQVELAKLRDMTRKELSVILDRDQLEEFLLRFSHNSSRLRQELRGLGLSADEFRKIFHATDQIDHQIQLEYGGEEALSARQREQLGRQRDQAVEGVLGQEKYAQLILSRDPLYRQAQLMVMQSGAADTDTQTMFELLKSSQVRRQQVQVDPALTAEQKQSAMIQINQEQMQRQRVILQPKP